MGFSRFAHGSNDSRSASHGNAPAMKASMYFAYGRDARDGIRSKTTFEAILAGERTSTTRFPAWPGYQRWTQMKAGDRVRFFADREMRGRHVDVVVDSVEPLDLATCSSERLEEWSKAEGWSVAHGRATGRRYGAGVQIRYHIEE